MSFAFQMGAATLRRCIHKSGNNSEPPLRGAARLAHENVGVSKPAPRTCSRNILISPVFVQVQSPLHAHKSLIPTLVARRPKVATPI